MAEQYIKPNDMRYFLLKLLENHLDECLHGAPHIQVMEREARIVTIGVDGSKENPIHVSSFNLSLSDGSMWTISAVKTG